MILIGLLDHDRLVIMADSQEKNIPTHALMEANKRGNPPMMIRAISLPAVFSFRLDRLATSIRSQQETRIDNQYLVERWQDWILANPVTVNHLNCLMTLASKQEFALILPAGYSVKYVRNTGSFRQTVSQLVTEVRGALGNSREDFSRVYNGMEKVPAHLKTTVLLLKHASVELLNLFFPDTFRDIEQLVNNSLVVLRRPEKTFQDVLNLMTEIDYLLRQTSADQAIVLEMSDVKTQWKRLTDLALELAQRAERMRESFLFQFNWILTEFIRPNLTLAESHRDFIIQILLPKLVEIDQTCDLLGSISQTYTEISSKFTDDQIGGYGHLLHLSQEAERKKYLLAFRSSLSSQVVYGARLALKRHTEYNQRDRNRKASFERFLTETSIDDLMHLLG